MGTFFAFLIKSAICLVIFYLFYKVLLSKETFHKFNRVGLLSLMLLSFALPIVSWFMLPASPMGVVVPEMLLQSKAVVVEDSSQTQAVDKTAVWTLTILVVYFLGVIVCLFRQLWSLVSLLHLIGNSRVIHRGKDHTLLVHDKNIAPFSWMKKVIISEKDLKENRDKILAHELAHIRKGHSFDLILADFCIFFQWFNPTSWHLKQELQSIHEFEADEVVLRQGIDAKQYQLLIIEKAVGTRLYSMANSFNHSSLKKRITMMLKEKSNPWARLKYLYVLPLTCVTMLAFARPEVSNLEKSSKMKIESSVALAGVLNGNRIEDKINEFTGTNKQMGVKNDLNRLVLADDKKTSTKTTATYQSPVLKKTIKFTEPVMAGESDNKKTAVKTTVKFTPPVISNTSDNGKGVSNTGNETKSGKIVVETNDKISDDIRVDDAPNSTFQDPEYPGGKSALLTYIQQSVRYPANALSNGIEGRVVCNFLVNADGKITDIKVLNSVDAELDNEAIRVIREMPNWTPGKKNGKVSAMWCSLPINFNMSK